MICVRFVLIIILCVLIYFIMTMVKIPGGISLGIIVPRYLFQNRTRLYMNGGGQCCYYFFVLGVQ